MKIFEREELQTRMIRNMRARSSAITYFGPGPIRSYFYALAVELQHLYYRLFRADLKQDSLRALGTDLDAIGAARGIPRLGASAASVVLEFTGTIGTNIPLVPTPLSVTSATGITYTVTETGTILSGTSVSTTSGIIKLVAQSAVLGESAKVPRGSLISIVNAGVITGGTVSGVTNPAASVGGDNTESDEQYRGRVVKYMSSLNLGTRAFYDVQVRTIDPTVVRTFVTKGSGPHSVKVIVASRSGGAYTAPQLTAIATGLNPLIPVQVVAEVANMVYTPVVVSFSGTLKAGYTSAAVIDAVARGINLFLDWSVWPFSKAVQWDDILAIASNTPGVDKIVSGSFLPIADIDIGLSSLPKLTSITFTDSTSLLATTFSSITTEFPRI